MSVRVRNSHHH